MKLRDLALAGVAASLFAVPALAHHSFAMFDQNKVNTMTGTVKQLEWVNPHAWLHVDVKQPDDDTDVGAKKQHLGEKRHHHDRGDALGLSIVGTRDRDP